MNKTERKIDTTIKVGDTVRSYDFQYIENCYVEGEVVELTENFEGCACYHIKIEKKVFNGKEVSVALDNIDVYPPVNGLESWMGGKTCGVQKLEENNGRKRIISNH